MTNGHANGREVAIICVPSINETEDGGRELIFVGTGHVTVLKVRDTMAETVNPVSNVQVGVTCAGNDKDARSLVTQFRSHVPPQQACEGEGFKDQHASISTALNG